MEQIAAVPVPQIKEGIVEVPPFPVPQVMEEIMKVTQSVPSERIQKRVGEQIAAVPVPQITEDVVEVTQHFPQERAEPNRGADRRCAGAPHQQGHRGYDSACASRARTSRGADRVYARAQDQGGCCGRLHVVPHEPRKKLVFLDWPRRPASQPNTGKVKCTGKVFTVKMRHHRGDQACAVDTAEGLSVKGLNKYNMPQSGDVMVPVPQIQEQIVDVGGQEQVIVREIPEVLVVEHLEDVKRAFAGWGKR